MDDGTCCNPGSRPLWITLLVGFFITLIFLGATLLFFYIGNNPPSSTLPVVNNCSSPVSVIISAGDVNFNNTQNLSSQSLAANESTTYTATPGTNVIIQGYSYNQIPTDALTTAQLSLAGSNYSRSVTLSDGTNVLENLPGNDYATDTYGVSMQTGYNIPIGISSDNPLCQGPTWYGEVVSTPGAVNYYPCPPLLQGANGTCNSPCSVFGTDQYCCNIPCDTPGGCENTWPQLDYYYTFAASCPNCLITNCDTLNYTCAPPNINSYNSSTNINNYTITFCPGV
jgi:hypothetical protein